MTEKPIVPRERAQRDAEGAIDHYLAEAGIDVAVGFVDELERTYARLSAHPASGSPRYAYELGIAELRSVPVGRYPYLIFYVERPAAVDVWRILHAKRDIPASLHDPDPSSSGEEQTL